ncbi:Hypothetical protein NTJ_16035 [Nesidiocoris tenuis]|uniref:Uncharacterized protein n=1 Tax=Nesidiocoris tenuis TaxID=355587 RepID=A0ABN7BIB9_9HEMI|nr:Hypothetical protein NTJ_16035 [Nesidiocoris tenuis]
MLACGRNLKEGEEREDASQHCKTFPGNRDVWALNLFHTPRKEVPQKAPESLQEIGLHPLTLEDLRKCFIFAQLIFQGYC